jgi:hypothetical protein
VVGAGSGCGNQTLKSRFILEVVSFSCVGIEGMFDFARLGAAIGSIIHRYLSLITTTGFRDCYDTYLLFSFGYVCIPR